MIEKLITELQEKRARAQERLDAARTEVQQYDKAVDALLGINAVAPKRKRAEWSEERRQKMAAKMRSPEFREANSARMKNYWSNWRAANGAAIPEPSNNGADAA